jgi:hypothetical protein
MFGLPLAAFDCPELKVLPSSRNDTVVPEGPASLQFAGRTVACSTEAHTVQ